MVVVERAATLKAGVLGCFAVALLSPALASTDYCSEVTGSGFVDINVARWGSQPLRSAAGDSLATQARELDSRWRLDPDPQHPLNLGFSWRYSIMDLPGVDTMTNGHLHRMQLPLEGRLKAQGATLIYHAAPVLAVSSNILKAPDLIDADSLQLDAGAVYQRPYSETTAWLLGLRADHRFASYRAYPVLGLCIEPTPDWTLQLALPDLRIERRIGQRLALSLFAGPAGASWHVASKDEARQSQFEYQATAIGLSAHWRFDRDFSLVLDLEQQRDRELAFRLNDNSLVETRVADSTGLRLRGIYRF